jgi:hypothetical protein
MCEWPLFNVYDVYKNPLHDVCINPCRCAEERRRIPAVRQVGERTGAEAYQPEIHLKVEEKTVCVVLSGGRREEQRKARGEGGAMR